MQIRTILKLTYDDRISLIEDSEDKNIIKKLDDKLIIAYKKACYSSDKELKKVYFGKLFEFYCRFLNKQSSELNKRYGDKFGKDEIQSEVISEFGKMLFEYKDDKNTNIYGFMKMFLKLRVTSLLFRNKGLIRMNVGGLEIIRLLTKLYPDITLNEIDIDEAVQRIKLEFNRGITKSTLIDTLIANQSISTSEIMMNSNKRTDLDHTDTIKEINKEMSLKEVNSIIESELDKDEKRFIKLRFIEGKSLKEVKETLPNVDYFYEKKIISHIKSCINDNAIDSFI